MPYPHAPVRTCLALGPKGGEAAEFYVSLLPNSRIEGRFAPDDSNKAMQIIELTLNGAPVEIFTVEFPQKLNNATSLSVLTSSQEETDRLWAALLHGGGKELQCGWLTDRFGVSWQIVPENLPRRLTDPDRAAAGRVMQAMMGMIKIDSAAIERAFKGETNA